MFSRGGNMSACAKPGKRYYLLIVNNSQSSCERTSKTGQGAVCKTLAVTLP